MGSITRSLKTMGLIIITLGLFANAGLGQESLPLPALLLLPWHMMGIHLPAAQTSHRELDQARPSLAQQLGMPPASLTQFLSSGQGSGGPRPPPPRPFNLLQKQWG